MSCPRSAAGRSSGRDGSGLSCGGQGVGKLLGRGSPVRRAHVGEGVELRETVGVVNVAVRLREMVYVDKACRGKDGQAPFKATPVDARIFLDLVVADARHIALVVAEGDEQEIELEGVQFARPPQPKIGKRVYIS